MQNTFLSIIPHTIYVLAKKIYEKQFIFMEIAMKQNNNEIIFLEFARKTE